MPYGFLLIPYIFFLTGGLFGWWYTDPSSISWVAGGIALGYLLGAWWLDQERRDWWRFAVSPLLLALSGLAFSSLVVGAYSALAILVIAGLLSLMYWRYAYLYVTRPGSYVPFSLERFSNSLNFLTVYFLAASAYGVKTFLDIPSWSIAVVFGLATILLWSQWAWANKISRSMAWRYGAVGSLVMIELFLLQGYSPVDFRLLAFPVATAYYALLTLMSLRAFGTLERRRGYVLAGIMLFVWLAVFLTARWF